VETLSVQSYRKSPLCVAAVAVLYIVVGCQRDTPVASRQPLRPIAKSAADNAQKAKPRKWADSQFPAGNEQTLKFLAWAKEKYEPYCSARLNEAGDCVELSIHPCWAVNDEELKVVSDLKQLQSLTIDAGQVTDDGLRHLEKLPHLKELCMQEASKVTDEGIQRLQKAVPNLKIALPYRQGASKL
jgi:hypothetical protein